MSTLRHMCFVVVAVALCSCEPAQPGRPGDEPIEIRSSSEALEAMDAGVSTPQEAGYGSESPLHALTEDFAADDNEWAAPVWQASGRETDSEERYVQARGGAGQLPGVAVPDGVRQWNLDAAQEAASPPAKRMSILPLSISGSGDFAIETWTCGIDYAPSTSGVTMTIASGGSVHTWRLPGDRERNTRDVFRFSWPEDLPSVDRLESISFQHNGSDAWCLSWARLTYLDRQIWRFYRPQPDAARSNVFNLSPTAEIWLDGDGALPSIRFSDARVQVSKRAPTGQGGYYLSLTTCGDGTVNDVRVLLGHDLVQDEFLFRGMSANSTYRIPLERARYVHRLNAIRLAKTGSDPVCIKNVFLELAVPDIDPIIWGQQLDRSLTSSITLAPNVTVWGCESSDCQTRYQGHPLKASRHWDRTVARCGSLTDSSCDGVDQDCDGLIDEHYSGGHRECGRPGTPPCQ